MDILGKLKIIQILQIRIGAGGIRFREIWDGVTECAEKQLKLESIWGLGVNLVQCKNLRIYEGDISEDS